MTEIRAAIHEAHSRIAGVYGLSLPGESEPAGPSYNHWNYLRTVRGPLEAIVGEHGLGQGRLLDAGCGNGQFLDLYARLTEMELTGADFSRAMLAGARRRSEFLGYGERLSLLQSDLGDLGAIPNETFDVVHCFGVVEHLDSPPAVLAELARVCKPGGRLVFGYPRDRSLSTLSYLLAGQSPEHWGQPFTWGQMLNLPSKRQHYRFFALPAMLRMLEFAGFRMLARYPVGYIHLAGFLGKPLEQIAARGERGYTLLSRIETLAKCSGVPPAGEYLVCERRPLPCA